MGNTATKFRKALINGDEVLACQLYESNLQFKEALDPNATYGESYQHNTPLHYAARHAMMHLLRSGIGPEGSQKMLKVLSDIINMFRLFFSFSYDVVREKKILIHNNIVVLFQVSLDNCKIYNQSYNFQNAVLL